jgi:hypoxanthine phosphoribosyltransferase
VSSSRSTPARVRARRRDKEIVIDVEQLPHEVVRFAHNSERQFAKLLDFYGIAWEYEPRTFTLEWDREGRPAQAFSPDFYLPAYDLFIEITTLNQKLVTKKNRKARRVVELYPDVNIRVLYQRDYLHLLVKYGLEPPSQLVDAGAPADGPPLQLGVAARVRSDTKAGKREAETA